MPTKKRLFCNSPPPQRCKMQTNLQMQGNSCSTTACMTGSVNELPKATFAFTMPTFDTKPVIVVLSNPCNLPISTTSNARHFTTVVDAFFMSHSSLAFVQVMQGLIRKVHAGRCGLAIRLQTPNVPTGVVGLSIIVSPIFTLRCATMLVGGLHQGKDSKIVSSGGTVGKVVGKLNLFAVDNILRTPTM